VCPQTPPERIFKVVSYSVIQELIITMSVVKYWSIPSESRQIIAPGVFNVTSISQDESPIVMRRTIQVAALSFNYQQYALGGGGGGSGGDSPVDIHRYYRFKLSAQDTSKQKIQVRSLTCRGVLDEPYDAVLPTFNEMQAAVGQYVKFDLKLIDM